MDQIDIILTHNWLEKAAHTLHEVEENFKLKNYFVAQSRLYYVVFYICTAFAQSEKIQCHSHKALLSWINGKHFINHPVLTTKRKRLLQDLFASRQKVDYSLNFTPLPEKLFIEIAEVKLFLTDISNFLESYFSDLLKKQNIACEDEEQEPLNLYP